MGEFDGNVYRFFIASMMKNLTIQGRVLPFDKMMRLGLVSTLRLFSIV
jgi:hypothetical protein